MSNTYDLDDNLESAYEIDKAKTQNEMRTGENSEANPYYHKMHHYWQYISTQCSNLETVKFVNFHKNSEGRSPNELGIRWVLLAIYKREDLQ